MKHLLNYTAEIIAKTSKLKQEQILSLLEIPADNLGDVALPCFSFAKEMKIPPSAIAENLANDIVGHGIAKVSAVGGYINIFFEPAFLADFLLLNCSTKSSDFYTPDIPQKTVLIEHTSINPNASPHVGRARNALIGDCLVRLFRFVGWKTDVHYFVNDVGKQIALLVYCTRNTAKVDFEDLLQLYIDANEQLKTNPEIEKSVFDLLNKFENGDKEVTKQFAKIVDCCIQGQVAIFNELGIKYDHFDYESKYIHNHITDKVLEQLKSSPTLFQDENGRFVLDQNGQDIGIDNAMLVITRADKTSLYPLRDICYSIDKANSGADKNIIVLGEDQKVYFQQIGSAMKLLGSTPAQVVHYSFVLLPEGKMSTRKGNVVLLTDFMREATQKANESLILRDGTGDLEKAKILGYGALKYSILKCSPEKNVLFDWQNALNFNGDSSLYIQYNYSRICSILQKLNTLTEADYSLLTTPEEIALIKNLSQFEETVWYAFKTLNPSIICTYVYCLTVKFSQYYNNTNIINTQDEALKNARGVLISKVAEVINNCLNILGIDVVTKM